MKIIVARHCQTDWNAQNRVQGIIDTELNKEGWRQAAELADKVSSEGVDRIVASTLMRAVQTAWVVAHRTRAPLTVDDRLRECSFGSLDGLPFIEFGLRCGPTNLSSWPDVLASDFSAFGGDKATDVFARQKALLDELKAEDKAQTAMVIGHGRSLRTLMSALGHDRKIAKQGNYLTIDY